MKFEFFEFQWADRPDWVEKAKAETVAIWQSKYKSSSRAASPFLPVLGDILHHESEEPLWRQRKRVRLAAERHDEFERFQGLEEQLHGIGPLDYWIQKRKSSDSRTRDLAAMAIDILSIPAMSAEPERVFSRYAIISVLFKFLSSLLIIQ